MGVTAFLEDQSNIAGNQPVVTVIAKDIKTEA